MSCTRARSTEPCCLVYPIRVLLFPSSHRCIKRCTSVWRGYNLFFLANLIIHSTDKLLLPRKYQEWARPATLPYQVMCNMPSLSIPSRPDKVAWTFRTMQGIPTGKSAALKWRLWAIRPEWAHAVRGITMRDTPQLISDCLGSCSVVFPRPPQVYNNEVKPPNLVGMRDIVLQCLHNGWGRKMRACQAAILPDHADERFIWRCTGEVAIMKIKVGLALPDMPRTICESISGWEPFLWCDVAFVLLALSGCVFMHAEYH